MMARALLSFRQIIQRIDIPVRFLILQVVILSLLMLVIIS